MVQATIMWKRSKDSGVHLEGLKRPSGLGEDNGTSNDTYGKGVRTRECSHVLVFIYLDERGQVER